MFFYIRKEWIVKRDDHTTGNYWKHVRARHPELLAKLGDEEEGPMAKFLKAKPVSFLLYLLF